MTRESTLEKQKIVVKEFQRLLRSGKDLTTTSMYEDAGKKCFLSGGTVGHIVQKYYNNPINKLITEEMRGFVRENESVKFESFYKLFCEKYKLCKREGRLILGYIR